MQDLSPHNQSYLDQQIMHIQQTSQTPAECIKRSAKLDCALRIHLLLQHNEQINMADFNMIAKAGKVAEGIRKKVAQKYFGVNTTPQIAGLDRIGEATCSIC